MKGESFHLCKLQMENRVIQTAKADSVIKGVSCFNITQNSSCLLWLLWCNRLWLVATGRTTSRDVVRPVAQWPVWPRLVPRLLVRQYTTRLRTPAIWNRRARVLNITVELAATNLPLAITHHLYDQPYALSAISHNSLLSRSYLARNLVWLGLYG